MTERQLDLFAADGVVQAPYPPAASEPETIRPDALDDAALIAAIPLARLADAARLAAEVGQRRLPEAVPVLETLCRRSKGFGLHRALSEQRAAVQALTAIGGRAAREAVGRLIADSVVQGPGLSDLVRAAAQLACPVPVLVLSEWLRSPDPALRADACGCNGRAPPIQTLLVELLGDLNTQVANGAACALGRLGRVEARPALLRLLRDTPSGTVIEAITPIADEVCLVELGRVGRTWPDLRGAVLDALQEMDQPRAAVIAAWIHRSARPAEP